MWLMQTVSTHVSWRKRRSWTRRARRFGASPPVTTDSMDACEALNSAVCCSRIGGTPGLPVPKVLAGATSDSWGGGVMRGGDANVAYGGALRLLPTASQRETAKRRTTGRFHSKN